MPTISRFIQRRGADAQLGGLEMTHGGAARWHRCGRARGFFSVKQNESYRLGEKSSLAHDNETICLQAECA